MAFGRLMTANELGKIEELITANIMIGIDGEASGCEWIGGYMYDWKMRATEVNGETMKVYLLVTAEGGVLNMIRIMALDGYEQEVFDGFLSNVETYTPALSGIYNK